MGIRKAKKAAKKAEKKAKKEQAAYDKQLAGDYWSNMKEWRESSSSSLERDLSTARAKYAASGGMEMYEQYEKTRTEKYEADLEAMNTGATGQFLDSYYKQNGASSGLSMDEYYGSMFDGLTPEGGNSGGATGSGLISRVKDRMNPQPGQPQNQPSSPFRDRLASMGKQGKSSFWG